MSHNVLMSRRVFSLFVFIEFCVIGVLGGRCIVPTLALWRPDFENLNEKLIVDKVTRRRRRRNKWRRIVKSGRRRIASGHYRSK